LIAVIIDYPLGDILRNQDVTGRISKWTVELGALNIDFKPRTTIKSQALVDFMAEWRENQLPTPTERPEHWVMYFDDSLKLEGAGPGVLLISPKGEQVLGSQQGEHGRLLPGSLQAREQVLWPRVPSCRLRQQRCNGCLSELGSTRAQVPVRVFIHELHTSSIPESVPTTTDSAPSQPGQEVMMIDIDWRQPFIDYIREQKVPSDKNVVEQLVRRAKSYVLVEDKLYRRGATYYSHLLQKTIRKY
jgi:hypothetical protein